MIFLNASASALGHDVDAVTEVEDNRSMGVAFAFGRQLHVVAIERLEEFVAIIGCAQREIAERDVFRGKQNA